MIKVIKISTIKIKITSKKIYILMIMIEKMIKKMKQLHNQNNSQNRKIYSKISLVFKVNRS